MSALVLLALATASAGPGRARGLQPARSTIEVLNAALEPRRVALVVGVDQYDDPAFPWLEHAGHDADLLAGVLADPAVGGFDEVVALPGSPTRDRVLTGLRQAARDLRSEDVLVVYFSGHGTRVERDGEARRYLLARDSRAASLDASSIDLESLQAWFGSLPPTRKVLIVDACFDGVGKSVLRPVDRTIPLPPVPNAPSPAGLGPGEAYLFATSPGRSALEDDQLGHGLYSYFLIEALSWSFAEADRDDDGVVTAWEAHDHARTRTIAWSNGAQVPEASFRVVGTADLVLAGTPSSRRKRDQALVYLYAPESDPLHGSSVTVDGRPRGVLPGTIPVDAGRHHFEIDDRDGHGFAEGWLDVRAGRPYRVEDLLRLLRGPSASFSLRPVVAGSPGLTRALRGLAIGCEATGALRDDQAPGRGWTLAGRVAVLGAGQRTVDGIALRDPRLVLDAGLLLGVQHDWQRLRGSLSGSLGGVWIPPDRLGEPSASDPYAAPSEAGWLFATLGANASGAFVLSEAVSAGLFARPQLTVLDLDGDRATEVVSWLTGGLSLEIVLE